MIRIVEKSYFNADTEPRFKDFNNLLKLQSIHQIQLGQFMFSCTNAVLPRRFVSIQGMPTPFHYHYVEQISGNSPYSIEVLNF